MKRITNDRGQKILVNESLVREIGDNTSPNPRSKTILFFVNDDVIYSNDTLDELELIFNNSENVSVSQA